jgi:hypothetical protein
VVILGNVLNKRQEPHSIVNLFVALMLHTVKMARVASCSPKYPLFFCSSGPALRVHSQVTLDEVHLSKFISSVSPISSNNHNSAMITQLSSHP